MLASTLFVGQLDLQSIADGTRKMQAPENSDSVALVQQSLLALGFSLPSAGVDNVFGAEMGAAISAFKTDRGLVPNDPVVGVGTITRLDLELSFLDGTVADANQIDSKVAIRDPFVAGIFEIQGFPAIGQKVLDHFEFGDRICARVSMLLGSQIAAMMGRFIEPFVFRDFAQQRGVSPLDFFDSSPSVTPYIAFLTANNPQTSAARIQELAARRRPDLLTHRPPGGEEWYEIKPVSLAGAVAAWKKFNSIFKDYPERQLPYKPGTTYQPTRDIVLANLITPQGENLDIILQAERFAPGLIFWTLCIKGDYVTYFNRVRLAAGLLAIIVALGEVLGPAAAAAGEVAGFIEAVQALAAQFGVGLLPKLLGR